MKTNQNGSRKALARHRDKMKTIENRCAANEEVVEDYIPGLVRSMPW